MTSTYRRELSDEIGRIVHESLGGSPWAVEVERALAAFESRLSMVIGADPVLAEIFNRPKPIKRRPESEEEIPF